MRAAGLSHEPSAAAAPDGERRGASERHGDRHRGVVQAAADRVGPALGDRAPAGTGAGWNEAVLRRERGATLCRQEQRRHVSIVALDGDVSAADQLQPSADSAGRLSDDAVSRGEGGNGIERAWAPNWAGVRPGCAGPGSDTVSPPRSAIPVPRSPHPARSPSTSVRHAHRTRTGVTRRSCGWHTSSGRHTAIRPIARAHLRHTGCTEGCFQ